MTDPMRRRRRLLWLIPLVALPLTGYALLAFLLEPERLGALLLQRAARTTGLELTVEEPPRLALWPRLQLELLGLAARMPGEPAALLRAERVDVALPLALLWGREDLEVGALRLQRPELDLGALLQWRAKTSEEQLAPLRLPQPAVALSLLDGRLIADGWALEALDLRLSPLREGERAELVATARLHTDTQQLPFSLQLDATPLDSPTSLQLQSIALRLGADDDVDVLQLEGDAEFGAQTRITLAGRTGAAWPTQWPALPERLAGELPGQPIEFDYDDSEAGPGAFAVQAGTAPRLALLRGNLPELRQWLASEPRTLLPPLDATLELDSIEFDGVRLDGVTVRLEPTAADD